MIKNFVIRNFVTWELCYLGVLLVGTLCVRNFVIRNFVIRNCVPAPRDLAILKSSWRPLFSFQSLLPVLSVAILPNSIFVCRLACMSCFHAANLPVDKLPTVISACRLASMSFFHAACLPVAVLPNFISACHLACLPFCHVAHFSKASICKYPLWDKMSHNFKVLKFQSKKPLFPRIQCGFFHRPPSSLVRDSGRWMPQ